MPRFEYVFTYRWTHPDGRSVLSTGTADSDTLLDEDRLKDLVLDHQSRMSAVPEEDIRVSLVSFVYSAAPFVSEDTLSLHEDSGHLGQVWLDSAEDIT